MASQWCVLFRNLYTVFHKPAVAYSADFLIGCSVRVPPSSSSIDDSDNTIFVYDNKDNNEIVTIGVYVDNLMIVHFSEIDDDGNVVDTAVLIPSSLNFLINYELTGK